jgi:hypothetical protein
MKKIIVAIATVVGIQAAVLAQQNDTRSQDEAAVRRITAHSCFSQHPHPFARRSDGVPG